MKSCIILTFVVLTFGVFDVTARTLEAAIITGPSPLASNDKVPIIWILGGPGSGKGTQSAKIVEKYGFSRFSTGDLLRAEIATGSDKGKEFAEIMKRGDLVPTEDVLVLLKRAMNDARGYSKGFLIDGYPREKSQGVAFERSIAPVDLIIFLDIKPETMVSRILKRASESVEKRTDDNEATITNRIQTFVKNTDEILSQYPVQTKRIDGERSIDEVSNDVFAAISAVLASK